MLGWSGLDPEQVEKRNAEARAQAEQETYEIAKQIAPAFTSPAGKKALAKLRELWVDCVVYQPGAGVNGVPDALYRDGQRNIVLWLETQVKIAQSGPPVSATVEERDDGKGKK